MGSRSTCALATGIVAATLLALPSASLTIQQIAVTGDVAPGTGGATWQTFLPIVTNLSGQVAFTATLTQGGAVDASNDLGMWSGPVGTLSLVERQGSLAPGGVGTWDVAIPPPTLNDAGQVAFSGSISAPSRNGIWHQGSGTLAPAALTGSPADGAPAGQNYASPFSVPTFNDAGQVAFHGSLAGTGVTTNNDRAVWVGGPTGALTMAAREGDAATGAGGALWSGFEGTTINGGGDVAFRATLDDGGTGIWAGPAAGVSLAARNGTAAPGTGGQFANFTAGDFNDAGQVAFHAGLEVGVGGVTSGDDRVIYLGAPGALGLVAREGDVAPDSGGGVFQTFSGVLLNDAGDALFRGLLDTGTGLYLGDSGALDKVVGSGDTATGSDIGLGDAVFDAFGDYALNDAGDVAFEAVLSGVGQGVTGSNDGSLWVMDASGALELIVREGQIFQVGLGDFAIVEEIDFFGAADTRGRGLNDHGWVTFGLTFTDGREGIYIATPEPGTAVLLAMGLVCLAARRRRDA